MKLLALDTSSLACSVALQLDDEITHRHEEQPREHTRLLVPMIRELLAESGITAASLDGIVLGNGPGSFIGMRIATSVAQGMAFAADVPVVPVSSLLAVAAEVIETQDCGRVVVCQDAHMDEVYVGIYSKGEIPVLLGEEHIRGLTLIEEVRAEPATFVGAGFAWHRYPELLDANKQSLLGVSEVHFPAARYLLAAGLSGLREGAAVAPEAANPAYLRDTVARRPDR